MAYHSHQGRTLRELFVCKISVQRRRTKLRLVIVSGVEMLSRGKWWEHVLLISAVNSLTDEKISLGDARSYYITTGRNDLGVIFATSEAGS
jgi:exosome complex RNA-binding protein Csl4